MEICISHANYESALDSSREEVEKLKASIIKTGIDRVVEAGYHVANDNPWTIYAKEISCNGIRLVPYVIFEGQNTMSGIVLKKQVPVKSVALDKLFSLNGRACDAYEREDLASGLREDVRRDFNLELSVGDPLQFSRCVPLDKHEFFANVGQFEEDVERASAYFQSLAR